MFLMSDEDMHPSEFLCLLWTNQLQKLQEIQTLIMYEENIALYLIAS